MFFGGVLNKMKELVIGLCRVILVCTFIIARGTSEIRT